MRRSQSIFRVKIFAILSLKIFMALNEATMHVLNKFIIHIIRELNHFPRDGLIDWRL